METVGGTAEDPGPAEYHGLCARALSPDQLEDLIPDERPPVVVGDSELAPPETIAGTRLDDLLTGSGVPNLGAAEYLPRPAAQFFRNVESERRRQTPCVFFHLGLAEYVRDKTLSPKQRQAIHRLLAWNAAQ
jgi:hypothetical protein